MFLDLTFVEGMKFGSAVDLQNGRLFVGSKALMLKQILELVVQYNNPRFAIWLGSVP
jgi:hypothetical protein